jgi:mannan endo-1,4-beta-mannosidase
MINLDNEVDLWAFTHARLRGDATSPVATQAGNKISYAEVVQLSVDYASAAKDVNPAVQILGPVNYGWAGYTDLQGAPDAMGRNFLNFYLQQMAAAGPLPGAACSTRSDVHWYPEAQGGGVRITNNDNSAAVVAARKQAPAQPLGSRLYRDELDHVLLLGRADPPAAAPQGQDRR